MVEISVSMQGKHASVKEEDVISRISKEAWAKHVKSAG
jgi:hypothetical protein